jgi:hypothetical protein
MWPLDLVKTGDERSQRAWWLLEERPRAGGQLYLTGGGKCQNAGPGGTGTRIGIS